MKSNGLLKFLLIPMALLLIFVGIRLFSGNRTAPATEQAASQLTPEEMKALGIEGDTPRDTVATLVGQVKQLRSELQTAVSDSKNQKAENERLLQRDSNIDQRIQTALSGERERLQQEQEKTESERQQTQTLLQDLQRRLEGMGSASGQAELPVGLGLQEGDGKKFGNGAPSDMRWIEPQDGRPVDKNRSSSGNASEMSYPYSFGAAQKPLETPGETVRHIDRETGRSSTLKTVYTVPANATLMGSIAMTALIGRVPIDGTVNDPYPFKVLIGADNLTANGIDIPEVAGAVVSGTASGDWTLSCVRGQIKSITFVFNDGTIRTLPSSGRNRDEEDQSSSNAQNGQSGLGWISDPYGIPCVSGERRSNAQQYLGTQALITAAGAGAASLIKSDNGSVAVVSGNNGSLGTVGISGNEAMGRILASGVQDMSQWVNKLYGQAFAAIYVQPGAQVAVHIDQSLNIDYDAKGRKVHFNSGGSHVPDLD